MKQFKKAVSLVAVFAFLITALIPVAALAADTTVALPTAVSDSELTLAASKDPATSGALGTKVTLTASWAAPTPAASLSAVPATGSYTLSEKDNKANAGLPGEGAFVTTAGQTGTGVVVMPLAPGSYEYQIAATLADGGGQAVNDATYQQPPVVEIKAPSVTDDDWTVAEGATSTSAEHTYEWTDTSANPAPVNISELKTKAHFGVKVVDKVDANNDTGASKYFTASIEDAGVKLTMGSNVPAATYNLELHLQSGATAADIATVDIAVTVAETPQLVVAAPTGSAATPDGSINVLETATFTASGGTPAGTNPKYAWTCIAKGANEVAPTVDEITDAPASLANTTGALVVATDGTSGVFTPAAATGADKVLYVKITDDNGMVATSKVAVTPPTVVSSVGNKESETEDGTDASNNGDPVTAIVGNTGSVDIVGELPTAKTGTNNLQPYWWISKTDAAGGLWLDPVTYTEGNTASLPLGIPGTVVITSPGIGESRSTLTYTKASSGARASADEPLIGFQAAVGPAASPTPITASALTQIASTTGNESTLTVAATVGGTPQAAGTSSVTTARTTLAPSPAIVLTPSWITADDAVDVSKGTLFNFYLGSVTNETEAAAARVLNANTTAGNISLTLPEGTASAASNVITVVPFEPGQGLVYADAVKFTVNTAQLQTASGKTELTASGDTANPITPEAIQWTNNYEPGTTAYDYVVTADGNNPDPTIKPTVTKTATGCTLGAVTLTPAGTYKFTVTARPTGAGTGSYGGTVTYTFNVSAYATAVATVSSPLDLVIGGNPGTITVTLSDAGGGGTPSGSGGSPSANPTGIAQPSTMTWTTSVGTINVRPLAPGQTTISTGAMSVSGSPVPSEEVDVRVFELSADSNVTQALPSSTSEALAVKWTPAGTPDSAVVNGYRWTLSSGAFNSGVPGVTPVAGTPNAVTTGTVSLPAGAFTMPTSGTVRVTCTPWLGSPGAAAGSPVTFDISIVSSLLESNAPAGGYTFIEGDPAQTAKLTVKASAATNGASVTGGAVTSGNAAIASVADGSNVTWGTISNRAATGTFRITPGTAGTTALTIADATIGTTPAITVSAKGTIPVTVFKLQPSENNPALTRGQSNPALNAQWTGGAAGATPNGITGYTWKLTGATFTNGTDTLQSPTPTLPANSFTVPSTGDYGLTCTAIINGYAATQSGGTTNMLAGTTPTPGENEVAGSTAITTGANGTAIDWNKPNNAYGTAVRTFAVTEPTQPTGTTFTYAWYQGQNQTDTTNGTAVEDGGKAVTGPNWTPSQAYLSGLTAPGTYYYYCVISAQNTGDTTYTPQRLPGFVIRTTDSTTPVPPPTDITGMAYAIQIPDGAVPVNPPTNMNGKLPVLDVDGPTTASWTAITAGTGADNIAATKIPAKVNSRFEIYVPNSIVNNGDGYYLEWQYRTVNGGNPIIIPAGIGWYGVNSSVLVSTPVTANMDGWQFRLVGRPKNVTGSAATNQYSQWVSLEVEDAQRIQEAPSVTITSAPESTAGTVSIAQTGNVTFTAGVQSGLTGATLAYQWQSRPAPTVATPNPAWADMSGATERTYTLENIQPELNGVSYRCVVSNNSFNGIAGQSNSLTLQVNTAEGAVIILNPTSASLINRYASRTATFNVSAKTDNGDDVTYSWYRRGASGPVQTGGVIETWQDAAAYLAERPTTETAIEGATSPEYTTPALEEGVYEYVCRVTNATNSALAQNSPGFFVVVTQRSRVPAISEPGPELNAAGGASAAKEIGTPSGKSVSLVCKATVQSQEALTYQWQAKPNAEANWSNLTGRINSTLTFTPSGNSNGWYYRCVVTNAAANESSNSLPYRLTVWNTATVPTVTAVDPQNILNATWTSSSVLKLTSKASIGIDGSFAASATNPRLTPVWKLNGEVAANLTDTPDSVTNVLVEETDSRATYESTLTIPLPTGAFARAFSGNWECVWTNEQETVASGDLKPSMTSGICQVSYIVPGCPTITVQPKDTTAAVGSTATFSVGAVLNEPAGWSPKGTRVYIWQRSKDGGTTWENCPAGNGQFTETYSVPITQVMYDNATAANDQGFKNPYTYRVNIGNRTTGCYTYSDNAVLTISPGTEVTPTIGIKDGLDLSISNNEELGKILSGGALSVSKEGNKVSSVLDMLTFVPASAAYSLRIVNAEGTALTADDIVGTGCKIELIDTADNDKVLDTVTIIVRGDVMGNGVISLTQLVRMAAAFKDATQLNALFTLAGDLDGSGAINLTDLVQEAAIYRAQILEATPSPSPEPTAAPTTEPTAEPTTAPTTEPTTEPTAGPTTAPTTEPTAEPTTAPTAEPTTAPTTEPIAEPTQTPSAA